MRVLPGTGPRNEVLRILGQVHDQRVYRPVRKELGEALARLKELDAADRMGLGYGANAAAHGAITALRNVVAALEAEGEDTGVELPPLREYIADPPRLREDLRQSIAEFLRAHVAEDLSRLRTFSLILFRDSDLNGAIATSLTERRDQWREALTQPARGRISIWPWFRRPRRGPESPPLAKVSTALGCLPCVVFLGDKPDPESARRYLLSRWSARRFQEPPPSVPSQDSGPSTEPFTARPTHGGAPWIATATSKVCGLRASRVDPRVDWLQALLVRAIERPDVRLRP